MRYMGRGCGGTVMCAVCESLFAHGCQYIWAWRGVCPPDTLLEGAGGGTNREAVLSCLCALTSTVCRRSPKRFGRKLEPERAAGWRGEASVQEPANTQSTRVQPALAVDIRRSLPGNSCRGTVADRGRGSNVVKRGSGIQSAVAAKHQRGGP
jgi:hypothetical protein